MFVLTLCVCVCSEMFSEPIAKPDADASKDPAVFKRLFDDTTKLIAVTAPWTPQTMQRAQRTAEAYRNANPGDTVITVRGANPFNNKAPGVEAMPFCFPLKTHSSPSNWALIHLIAKMLGISFGAKGGMNFAWLLKQHGKYGNIMALIPEHRRETTAAKAAQGLIDIFAATIAEFHKHCEPGRQEFDLATAEELAIIHEFIQARVRALFRELGLNEPTYAEFMELMSFDSGFWADLFKDEAGKFSQEIKAQITDGWLKFVCRCCALAPMVTLPLATDPLEMLPVPMLAWLLKHGLISEDFFTQGVEAALGAGISSQLFAKIVASFPDGAIANFLRDYGKIILLAIVDDEGDDFFFLSLVHSRAFVPNIYPFTVVHMAAPNIVYGNDPKVLTLNMKAFWDKLLPAFPHEIEFCPDSIANADKVFGIVNSFIHAAEEKGDDLETKRAATAARVKRARDCTVTGFKDFNAKKQRTSEDYQGAVATSWGLFDAQ